MPPFYLGGSKGPATGGPPILPPTGVPVPIGGLGPVSPPGPKLPTVGSPKPPTTIGSVGGGQPSGSVLGAQAIRPTGPTAGYDPQYLQNLATAIGGLFSRPGGNLSFNPLGNLSDVSSPNLGFGGAPLPGLPSTLLQDAINGLSFMFNPPKPPVSPNRPNPSSNPLPGFGSGGRGNSPILPSLA